MIRRVLRAVLFLWLAVCFSPDASADERVLQMDVDISVLEDASIVVRERLEIRTEGNRIMHGLIRSVPIYHRERTGRRKRTELTFVGAKIDGEEAPVHLYYAGGNTELRIGSYDEVLPIGVHVFEIEYKVLGYVGSRSTSDELLWSVTDYGWMFPIDRATFRMHLPGEVRPNFVAARVTTMGEKTEDKSRANTASLREDGSVVSTVTIMPGENLLVTTSWPKGIVASSGKWVRFNLHAFLYRWRLPATVFFVLTILLYYGSMWRRVGKDPRQRTTIPLFRPPHDVEPGFAAYLKNKKFTDDILPADLIHLAVLGYLYFTEEDGMLRIMPTPKTSLQGPGNKVPQLSPPLKRLVRRLFKWNRQVGVGVVEGNGDLFEEVSARLHQDYAVKAARMFSLNRQYVILGLFLFIPIMLYLCLVDMSRLGVPGLFHLLVNNFFFLTTLYFSWRSGQKKSGLKRAVSFLLLASFGGLAGYFAYQLYFAVDRVLFTGMLVGGAIAAFFSYHMPAYTVQGMRTLEEVEGLAMYMRTAERARLEHFTPPEETPAHFEALLSYAYALRCADTWVDRFEKVLREASYVPEWDQADTARTFDAMRFSSRLSVSLARGLQTSVVASAPSRGLGKVGGGIGGGRGF